MRLPGFVHAKDPARPFRSRLVYKRDERHSAAQVLDAFAIAATPEPAADAHGGH